MIPSYKMSFFFTRRRPKKIWFNDCFQQETTLYLHTKRFKFGATFCTKATIILNDFNGDLTRPQKLKLVNVVVWRHQTIGVRGAEEQLQAKRRAANRTPLLPHFVQIPNWKLNNIHETTFRSNIIKVHILIKLLKYMRSIVVRCFKNMYVPATSYRLWRRCWSKHRRGALRSSSRRKLCAHLQPTAWTKHVCMKSKIGIDLD